MKIEETVVCAECGVSSKRDTKKCPYCNSLFAPVSEPLPGVGDKLVRPQTSNDEGGQEVGSMRRGQIGWVVPWALSNNPVGIHRNHCVLDGPRGTATVKIKMGNGVVLVDETTYSPDEVKDWWKEVLMPIRVVRL